MKALLAKLVEPFILSKIEAGKASRKQTSTKVGAVGVAGAAVYATQATTEQEALIAAAVAIINLYFIYKPSK